MGLLGILSRRRDDAAPAQRAPDSPASSDATGLGAPAVTIIQTSASPLASASESASASASIEPSSPVAPTARPSLDASLNANSNANTPTPTSADVVPARRAQRRSSRLDLFRPTARAPKRERDSLAAGKRLSQRLLHLGPARPPGTSERVPENLPQIVLSASGDAQDQDEEQWECRATLLAERNETAAAALSTERLDGSGGGGDGGGGGGGGGAGSGGKANGGGNAAREAEERSAPRSRSPSMSSKAIDEDIQEAIRLHEAGRLEEATRIFGRLADESGANNPLSQVLYGLALRHGWGCPPDPAQAVHYLTAAASNAASVEQLALRAGLKKGGAAKGELVLAIFELANCFRHGWGIAKDPVAAKQYYETAANLGDSGECKAFHRIWKTKYDPPGEKNLGVTV
ncbi:hypothetical protein ESCO_004848 [Escovopsis weberi]|uniref:Protein DSF2 n=1 Tax=Escovopsis weberi TaxID=150374 RepID=A0A0M9VRK6_ESCWE|nr:hypothetical protein ESCO_004848 [Escovopsis weberi]